MENINNINKELKELGIELPLGQKDIQSIPKNYFEEFPSRIAELIQYEDSLASVSKEMPHFVPKDYFELQTSLTIQKILEQDKTPQMEVHRPKKWYNMAAAASIAILLSIGMFLFSSSPVDQSLENQIAELQVEEVDQFLYETPYDQLFGKTLDLIENSTVDVESLEQDILSEIENLNNDESHHL